MIIVLFGLYLAILMKLLVFRYSSTAIFNFSGSNFIPFKTITSYLSNPALLGVALRNLLGNIFIFIPLGIFIPLFRPSSKWKIILITGLVISSIMGIIQGIFKVGVFDVDDIMLNGLGTLLGYGFFVLCKMLLSFKNKPSPVDQSRQ